MRDFKLPDLGETTADVAFASMAKTFVERLQARITKLQSDLPPTKQLAVKLVLQGAPPLLVRFIGYHNPSLVVFTGLDSNGNECTVLAHQNTVQLVCESVPVEGDKPRPKIGFQTGGGQEG